MDRLLVVISQRPYHSIESQEGLDVILTASVFTQCSVLFLSDGILQLLPDQRANDMKIKVFTRGYAALPDYGIEKFYCQSIDLEKWSLDSSMLLLQPITLTPAETNQLIQSFDKVLNL
jgi:tRNA 2-thiouridine synthesizing protein C